MVCSLVCDPSDSNSPVLDDWQGQGETFPLAWTSSVWHLMEALDDGKAHKQKLQSAEFLNLFEEGVSNGAAQTWNRLLITAQVLLEQEHCFSHLHLLWGICLLQG